MLIGYYPRSPGRGKGSNARRDQPRRYHARYRGTINQNYITSYISPTDVQQHEGAPQREFHARVERHARDAPPPAILRDRALHRGVHSRQG